MIRDKLRKAGIDLIIKKKKIKNINLRFLNAGKLQISVPLHITDKKIDEVLNKKFDWIIKYNTLLIHQNALIKINPDKFVLMDMEYDIEYSLFLLDGVELDHINHKLIIGFGLKIDLYRDQIYKAMAKNHLKPMVYNLANKLGFKVNKVFIRGQKNAWGTCSSKGNISLNWKLMIAPEYVIEYMIYHELLHLRHPNHGAQYKKELRQLYPRTDEAELWLKQHSQILKIY